MTMINRLNTDEMEVHRFCSFASDIGLRPGQWPSQLETCLGNEMPFISERVSYDADGDIQFVVYRQANGCITLKIFND